MALRRAVAKLGLRYSHGLLRSFRQINEALWELYRRGEIAQADLARDRFRRLLLGVGADPRRAAAFDRSFLAELGERGDLLPGCRAMLTRLGRRFRLGVVTNGIDRVQRSRLEAAGLGRHFAVVVTSEACGFAKPDPRIVHAALSALSVAPREAVFVGDDLRVDGGAARAAGVPFVWLDQGQPVPAGLRRPRRYVRSLTELLSVLGGL